MIKVNGNGKYGLRIFPEDIECVDLINNDVSIYLKKGGAFQFEIDKLSNEEWGFSMGVKTPK